MLGSMLFRTISLDDYVKMAFFLCPIEEMDPRLFLSDKALSFALTICKGTTPVYSSLMLQEIAVKFYKSFHNQWDLQLRSIPNK